MSSSNQMSVSSKDNTVIINAKDIAKDISDTKEIKVPKEIVDSKDSKEAKVKPSSSSSSSSSSQPAQQPSTQHNQPVDYKFDIMEIIYSHVKKVGENKFPVFLLKLIDEIKERHELFNEQINGIGRCLMEIYQLQALGTYQLDLIIKSKTQDEAIKANANVDTTLILAVRMYLDSSAKWEAAVDIAQIINALIKAYSSFIKVRVSNSPKNLVEPTQINVQRPQLPTQIDNRQVTLQQYETLTNFFTFLYQSMLKYHSKTKVILDNARDAVNEFIIARNKICDEKSEVLIDNINNIQTTSFSSSSSSSASLSSFNSSSTQ